MAQSLIKELATPLVFFSMAYFSFSFDYVRAEGWTEEDYLSGMDSVFIYEPLAEPLLGGKRALMISLHGCLMSNKDMKDNAGWQLVADEYGMVVVLPDAPGGGPASYNCWDYYSENHTRANKFNNEILSLVEVLKGREYLNIDPNQIYITGFSSGGGLANVMACLAPDVFAGVGSAAAPGLGTTNTQYGKVPLNYSAEKIAVLCRRLAAGNQSFLNTQLYSTVHGESDPIVSPEYAKINAEIMSLVYKVMPKNEAHSAIVSGSKYIASDAIGSRVSRVKINEMLHTWPTGNDKSEGYFINNKINYPKYVTQWFFENNRRVAARNGGSGK